MLLQWERAVSRRDRMLEFQDEGVLKQDRPITGEEMEAQWSVWATARRVDWTLVGRWFEKSRRLRPLGEFPRVFARGTQLVPPGPRLGWPRVASDCNSPE